MASRLGLIAGIPNPCAMSSRFYAYRKLAPGYRSHMDEVKVVVAHWERMTLSVGDVFLTVDTDHERIDVEVEAMSLARVPTPKVLWRKPPVLAIAALPRDDAWTPRRAVDEAAYELALARIGLEQLHGLPASGYHVCLSG